MRTLVTILGIILSVAMFTAITTCVVSFQKYLVDVAVDRNGSWYGSIDGLSGQDKAKLEENEKVKDSVSLEEIGYGKIDGIQNKNKPYLYIVGANEDVTTLLSIKITDGKMPEVQGEILLPEHLSSNGGVDYKVGDILELEVGTRFGEDGTVLRQNNPFMLKEENDGQAAEQLENLEKKTYTVVGFYERPAFEEYTAPGYTALTVEEEKEDAVYRTFFTTKKAEDVYVIGNIEETFGDKQISESEEYYDLAVYEEEEEGETVEINCQYNKELLRYMGKSNNDGLNRVLYSLALILIGIIMLGSVSLIYNAFSISISERTKQFGLLKSIGATRRQIKNSVFFEAFILCIIGLPLGILAGIGGIGVTFYLLSDVFKKGMFSDYSTLSVNLSVVVTWQSVVAAVCISIVTVLISSFLPARRAMKMNVIEAIRQSQDIKLNVHNVKSPKCFYKIFGLEGMLAQKYFKRNKKRYRATVISLFFSIVIFISTSSFCAYLETSVKTLVNNKSYDILYREEVTEKDGNLNWEVLDQNREKLLQAKGVDSCSYSMSYLKEGMIMASQYTEGYLNMQSEMIEKDETIYNTIYFVFLDDDTFSQYLEKSNLKTSVYMDRENPTALLVNMCKIYNEDLGKYRTEQIIKSNLGQLKMFVPKKMEGYNAYIYSDEDTGELSYRYIKEDGDDQETTDSEEKKIAITEENQVEVTLNVGADVTGNLPDGVDTNFFYCMLIYPYSARETILTRMQCDGFEGGFHEVSYKIKAKDHKTAYNSLTDVIKAQGKAEYLDSLYDVAEEIETNRSLITVVRVFSYGFTTLITFIAVANVFNTISTNIQLRRREFAMLKSVGMTQKGLLHMMNYECILCGMKSLIFGILAAFGVTYLIYRSILNGWETRFFIPWDSVIIAVAGVFLVVFSTMLYAMNKIKKENVIDELRRESV